MSLAPRTSLWKYFHLQDHLQEVPGPGTLWVYKKDTKGTYLSDIPKKADDHEGPCVPFKRGVSSSNTAVGVGECHVG